MAPKTSSKKNSKIKINKKKEVRVRKWTDYELKQFAYVLADEVDDFAFKLESLALKKSANEQIFQRIKEEFDARLRRNTKPTESESEEKHEQAENDPIDTSITKLRNKYKYLKDQWRKITDRAKTGSGKEAKEDPEWYKILNPIFSETHTKLKLASKARDILSSDSSSEESDECNSSFSSVTDQLQSLEKKRSLSPNASWSEKSDVTNQRDQKHKNGEDEDISSQPSTSDSGNKIDKGHLKSSSVAPRKRKKVTTQAQALSQLSASLENMGESQKQRMEMWLMAEQRREEAYLKYQERQSELNRQHELRMVQLFASLENKGNSQPSIPVMHNHIPIGHHSSHPAATAVIQHPNPQHIAWSVANSSIPFSSAEHNSNEDPIYTNLDVPDYQKYNH